MTPKISIIIPTYNREKVISKTLDSILSQSFDDWECLVVDDFSTDSTWSVLEEYASKDSRIRVLKNERTKGACGARNTGIKHARCSFLHFFDSDDKMHENLLSELYGHLTDNLDVITCWTNVIDINTGCIIEKFEHITEGNIHHDLLSGKTYVDTNCALIRRDVVEKINGWSEDCPSYQEWDFHLRLSTVARYATLHKHLIDYYVGGVDTISKSLPKAIKGTLYILKKYKTDFLENTPFSFLKYNFATFCRIHQLGSRGEKNLKREMKRMYNDSTPFLVAVLVRILYVIRCVKVLLQKIIR